MFFTRNINADWIVAVNPWARKGAGHDFAKAKSLLAHASWIEAEILFARQRRTKKCAQIFCQVLK
jgi:hypothetical protein